VELAGFRAFPTGHDQQGRHYSEDHPEWLTIPIAQRIYWMIRTLWADEWARPMVADLLALSRTWAPDLVVREGAEYGGCLAAEVLGIPHASVRAGSISSSYAQRHAGAEPLGRLRGELAWPDPAMGMLHRYLHLACEPPILSAGGPKRRPCIGLRSPMPAGARLDRPTPARPTVSVGTT
jgi:hypothetical protein